MRYRKLKGYKYELLESASVDSGIAGFNVSTEYVALTPTGHLTVAPRYAWDGPSGPTIDTPSFMRGSLFHDALYQLIREHHLPESVRRHADDLLRRLCLEDGMWSLRAWYVWRFVRRWGRRSATGPERHRVVEI